eukprot:1527786-Pleurochrysis_carterae.AAC.1
MRRTLAMARAAIQMHTTIEHIAAHTAATQLDAAWARPGPTASLIVSCVKARTTELVHRPPRSLCSSPAPLA